MTIFDNVFPLGLGTNRFLVAGPNDEEGLEQSANIVVQALDAGVNFIDVTHTYSRGMAFEVLRRAFQRTDKRPGVTIKTRLDLDKTADGVLRRAEFCLNSMGLVKAKYFYVWSLFSLDEFYRTIAPGGLYDGARRLQDEGIVEHICCSVHARPEEIIKIMESGAFEGMTISYSLINALRLDNVLRTAQEHQIGLAVMNPLGGGIIPKNPDYFSFSCNAEEKNTTQAALRFIQARPEIQVILSGVSTSAELEANLQAVQQRTAETDEARILRVTQQIKKLEHFCTGCNYCSGCPQGIPISDIMQSRNNMLFQADNTTYQAKSPETLKNIHLLSKLEGDFSVLFETPENPCIQCGKCEKACTQRLPVMEAIADTYQRAKDAGFSVKARKDRLDELLNGHGYQKVGFYPSGAYTQWVVSFYRRFFGEPPFEMELFDSNPSVWGTADGGVPVYGPDDILKEKPDCIIITSYKYKEEIYKSIRHYEGHGIRVMKFHKDQDVPWLF